MATIGTFTASNNGFTGSVKTPTLNVKATFVATEKENDKAPDYRILAGATEFGATWKKTARQTDREYLSVKLDDPKLPAPIYGSNRPASSEAGFFRAHGPRPRRRADILYPAASRTAGRDPSATRFAVASCRTG